MKHKSRYQKKTWGPRKQSTAARQRKALSETQTNELWSKIKAAYSWEPYDFQLEGIKSQLQGVDAIIQAATSAGKTAIAAGPHLWMQGVTIMATPLIQLAEEMVQTFKTEFKLSAIAIHSNNGGVTPSVVKDVLAGRYQIILASPEMLQSNTFINRILRNQAFAHRVISLFVDEAHCISHWGADFRKSYGTLGTLRAFLPDTTPVIAVSATLTARVRRDIHSKLHFSKTGSTFINLGNDRPNISIVVRACQHPLNTLRDLECALPEVIDSAEDIPKTWIYADSIDVGMKIVRYLRDLLGRRNGDVSKGIIRPFSARFSHKYRQEAMQGFRDGEIRILVCTEAAGMGCNIRDIDVIIQWKLPATLSNFVQRAGRAARDGKRQGIAILLVEPSAYVKVITEENVAGVKEKKGAKTAAEKKVLKEYAISHGLNRGGSDCQDDVPDGEQPYLDLLADDEGLLAFVQSVTCRRAVWAKMFDSPSNKAPTVPCCDICDPSLLNRARAPPASEKIAPSKQPVKGVPNTQVQDALETWREMVLDRDYAHNLHMDASRILSDAQVTLLASVGNLDSELLEQLLKGDWLLWNKYNEEILTEVAKVAAPLVPLPKKTRAPKRSLPDEAADTSEPARPPKRVRSDAASAGPSTVPEAQTFRLGPLSQPKETVQQSAASHPSNTQSSPPAYPWMYYPPVPFVPSYAPSMHSYQYAVHSSYVAAMPPPIQTSYLTGQPHLPAPPNPWMYTAYPSYGVHPQAHTPHESSQPEVRAKASSEEPEGGISKPPPPAT